MNTPRMYVHVHVLSLQSVLVYKDSGYVETVAAAAEQSMVRAVKEVTEKSGGQEVSTLCAHK